MPALLDILPIELIQPILCQLDDKHDLTTAALVCRSFNYAATPLIYREIGTYHGVIAHPSATLLQRPELARYVWHVKVTGSAMRSDPRIAQEIIAALSLCTNLVSATWVDFNEDAEAEVFMPFLEVLITLPLKEFIIIHGTYGMGDRAWTLLNSMTGLQQLSVSSRASPLVLQGLAAQGHTLRDLDLECHDVPLTTLISMFSQLPLLQTLRISGVPSAAIPSIMACLPNLVGLSVDYENYHLPSTPLPHLQRLVIKTTLLDDSGTDELWNWTCSLIPHEGSLQSFTLISYTIAIPLSFVTRLILRHGRSLTHFCAGIAQISPEVLVYLCRDCPALELLQCSVASADVQTIAKAIEPAKNLRTLHFVSWTRAGVTDTIRTIPFSEAEAKTLMLRPGSKLRTIMLRNTRYFGKWVRATPERDPVSQIEDGLTFEVVKYNEDPWFRLE